MNPMPQWERELIDVQQKAMRLDRKKRAVSVAILDLFKESPNMASDVVADILETIHAVS